MTLEEKAENYAWNYPIPYSLYEKIGDKKKLLGDVLEQVYIAGATENGIIWHDLRKNPDDLPEIRHTVCAKLDSGTYVFAYCVNGIWHRNDDGIILYHGDGRSEVIAWCEIPQYTEEEA